MKPLNFLIWLAIGVFLFWINQPDDASNNFGNDNDAPMLFAILD